MYDGTIRAISEPNVLIAISEPIPRYWPITIFEHENQSLRRKPSK
jgi:hypothetical protein